MNLIPAEMTNEAATLLERAKQLHTDAAALVADARAFDARRGDSLPQGLSLQAQDELYGWLGGALGVDELCEMLEVTVSAIFDYQDRGVVELSDETVSERVAMADLTLAALRSGSAAGHLAAA